MAVKIRLKRMGKIRAPFYRVVVMDSRTKRDGRAIEEIGKYHPTLEPSLIEIDSERARHWLGVGAQPTDQVLALLKITGDWQAHKGLPGAEGTLKVAPPRPDRRAMYEAAMVAAGKLDDEHGRPSGAARRRGAAGEDASASASPPAATPTAEPAVVPAAEPVAEPAVVPAAAMTPEPAPAGTDMAAQDETVTDPATQTVAEDAGRADETSDGA